MQETIEIKQQMKEALHKDFNEDKSGFFGETILEGIEDISLENGKEKRLNLDNKDELRAILKDSFERFNVKNIYMFGSAARREMNSDSDVDFIVDFDEMNVIDYSDNYFGLREFLSQIFNRKVDLLEQQALNNPYLIEEINKSKILLYEKAN